MGRYVPSPVKAVEIGTFRAAVALYSARNFSPYNHAVAARKEAKRDKERQSEKTKRDKETTRETETQKRSNGEADAVVVDRDRKGRFTCTSLTMATSP